MLSDFSEDELIEELARRRNAKPDVLPEDVCHWCHDCGNFIPWTNQRKKIPEDYNPCKKGHEMRFVVPDINGDPHADHGFFRLVCADRDIA